MLFSYEGSGIAGDFDHNKDVPKGFLDKHVTRLRREYSDNPVITGDDVTGYNPIIEDLNDVIFDIDEEDVADFTFDALESDTVSKCYVAAAGYMLPELSKDSDKDVRVMVAYQGEELYALMEDHDPEVAEVATMMEGFRLENQWLASPITIVCDPDRIIIRNSEGEEYVPECNALGNASAAPLWLRRSVEAFRTPEGDKAVSIAQEKRILPVF